MRPALLASCILSTSLVLVHCKMESEECRAKLNGEYGFGNLVAMGAFNNKIIFFTDKEIYKYAISEMTWDIGYIGFNQANNAVVRQFDISKETLEQDKSNKTLFFFIKSVEKSWLVKWKIGCKNLDYFQYVDNDEAAPEPLKTTKIDIPTIVGIHKGEKIELVMYSDTDGMAFGFSKDNSEGFRLCHTSNITIITEDPLKFQLVNVSKQFCIKTTSQVMPVTGYHSDGRIILLYKEHVQVFYKQTDIMNGGLLDDANEEDSLYCKWKDFFNCDSNETMYLLFKIGVIVIVIGVIIGAVWYYFNKGTTEDKPTTPVKAGPYSALFPQSSSS